MKPKLLMSVHEISIKSLRQKKIKTKHLVNHLTANHATQHVQSLAGDVKSLSVAVCIHELNYYGRVI
jgi:hypothetical protein